MPAVTVDQDADFAAEWNTIPSGERGDGTGGPTERVTVNVTGRAFGALSLAADLTGDTRTDTLNRALQVYAYLEQVTSRGGSVYVREAADSEMELLEIF